MRHVRDRPLFDSHDRTTFHDESAYDTNANDPRNLNAEVLRRQTFIEGGNAVLELGCGTALNTEWLAAQAGHVVATDVSDEMLTRTS